METQELKELWSKYDAKLEQSWSLNLKLIKEMNLQKTKTSMNNFSILKGLSLAFQIVVIHFLTNFIIDNYQNLSLTIQAGLLMIMTYIAMIWNFYQIGLIFLIKYNDPIIVIQKKIEKLKIQKLRYNKFIFVASYPFIFLMMFTVLHLSPIAIDYFPIAWIIPNIILAILWLPFCYWLLKKYNKQNIPSAFWRKMSRESTLTPDSVSKSLNNSLTFLSEIRKFEQAG